MAWRALALLLLSRTATPQPLPAALEQLRSLSSLGRGDAAPAQEGATGGASSSEEDAPWRENWRAATVAANGRATPAAPAG